MATPGPQTAGELACKAVEKGCDLILAAGGDGTINEAVNGIAGSQVPFGILPAGTANVLANEIGFANRPDHAAKQLLDATPVRIALGALDRPDQPRRHFVLMTGVGLDARIVYELDLDLKGKLAIRPSRSALSSVGEWREVLREFRSHYAGQKLWRRF
jgi:diacylglycerol kinase (ATP)